MSDAYGAGIGQAVGQFVRGNADSSALYDAANISPEDMGALFAAGRQREERQAFEDRLAELRAARGAPLGYTQQRRVAGRYVPRQTYYEQDFLGYVNNLDVDDQAALARAMYAQGLYGRSADIADIMDPALMVDALQGAVYQARDYAQFFEDSRMIPTLQHRFAGYEDMTDEEILAEFIRRGGGGGGGGGGRVVRLPDPAALRDTLEAASSQVLGRTATDAEKRMFVEGINAAVRAGESVDVGARAGVFAREQAPVEAGAMDLKNAGNLVLRALGLG